MGIILKYWLAKGVFLVFLMERLPKYAETYLTIRKSSHKQKCFENF